VPAIAKPRKVLTVRSLTKADLVKLYEPRRVPVVQKLKDSHHHLARLFASGLNIPAVARRVGRTVEAVRRIRQSPAFEQLVAEYRNVITEKWAESVDDYYEIACGNMVRAELQLADRLGEAEDAGETLPVRDLIAISRDAADRFGYGKRQTNVNVNADFASILERAVRRSGKGVALTVVSAKAEGAPQQIEGTVCADVRPPLAPGVSPQGGGDGPPGRGTVAPFIRRRA
jgi:hypothetical protein